MKVLTIHISKKMSIYNMDKRMPIKTFTMIVKMFKDPKMGMVFTKDMRGMKMVITLKVRSMGTDMIDMKMDIEMSKRSSLEKAYIRKINRG